MVGLCTLLLTSGATTQAGAMTVTERVLGDPVRLSVTGAGAQAPPTEPGTLRPQVSADARFVVFQTRSALVARDTNEQTDVYLYDRREEITTRVSVDWLGRQTSYWSGTPDVSEDGRYVAFVSRGAMSARVGTPGERRVYVRDRLARTTRLVSVTDAGEPAEDSFRPSMSADGRRIAFLSNSEQFGGPGVHVRDISGRTLTMTLGPDGTPKHGSVFSVELSGDGRSVAFATRSRGLSPDGPRWRSGLYVRTVDRGVTEWIGQPSIYHRESSLSTHGRFVAFTRKNPSCGWGFYPCQHVIVLDRTTGERTIASTSIDGERADDYSVSPALSGRGRWVLFMSGASNLVAGDTNDVDDVFLRDMWTGVTVLVSQGTQGDAADGPSGTTRNGQSGVAIAAGGRYLVFESEATNLVGDDINGVRDLFARSWLREDQP